MSLPEIYHLASGRLHILRVWEKALLVVAMYPEQPALCSPSRGLRLAISQL